MKWSLPLQTSRLIRHHSISSLLVKGFLPCFVGVALLATACSSPEKRAERLVAQMTLEEKVSQMMHESPAIPRLGIERFNWWNEALHGVGRQGTATVFPMPIAMAATFDDIALRNTFSMVADEAINKLDTAHGLSFFTPNINIFRDPRWGRGMETYGEDPYLTSRMGVAVVRGLQEGPAGRHEQQTHRDFQGGTAGKLKTLACAKHFAVHSGPEGTRHHFDVSVSERDLRETYLPAFEALVKKGNVQMVMCAYNRYEGKPCCASDKLLMKILREEWHYDNIVVTDCWAINDFYVKGYHGTHTSAVDAFSDAVRNGTDLECGVGMNALLQGVRQGNITEEEIDKSLVRIFTARFKLRKGSGIGQKVLSSKSSSISPQEHRMQALEMARKSIVLLKNDSILPLSREIKKIAVIGPNANDSVMQWGNYNGFPISTVTILEGIRRKLPFAEVTYQKGCELIENKTNDHLLDDPVASAGDADVIIFAGGISPKVEGEDGDAMGDRSDIELPAPQRSLLKALKATGKPVVLVLCTGSAIAIEQEDKELDAILLAWYGGESSGTAVADVLFGDYNPAGRLPVTFYSSSAQLPPFEDYSMSGRTYKYFTQEPLYPFGYGLSYTSFAYKDPSVSYPKQRHSQGKPADTLFALPAMLSISVRNTGAYDGEDVVQLYVKNIDDPTAPHKSLKGFKRVFVPRNGTQKVTFHLDMSTFECFNYDSGRMEFTPGHYLLMFGGSSSAVDTISVVVP